MDVESSVTSLNPYNLTPQALEIIVSTDKNLSKKIHRISPLNDKSTLEKICSSVEHVLRYAEWMISSPDNENCTSAVMGIPKKMKDVFPISASILRKYFFITPIKYSKDYCRYEWKSDHSYLSTVPRKPLYKIKGPSYKKIRIKSLRTIKEGQNFKDVSFLVDGKEIQVHKTLVLQSPVLKELLEKAESPLIEFAQADHLAFKRMVNYLYSGTIPNRISESGAEKLYDLADYLKLTHLKQLCHQKIHIVPWLLENIQDDEDLEEEFSNLTDGNSIELRAGQVSKAISFLLKEMKKEENYGKKFNEDFSFGFRNNFFKKKILNFTVSYLEKQFPIKFRAHPDHHWTVEWKHKINVDGLIDSDPFITLKSIRKDFLHSLMEDSSRFKEITFLVEGKEISIHGIFCLQSPIFQEFFHKLEKEQMQLKQPINFDETDYETFRLLVHYLYLGKIPNVLSVEQYFNLIKCAKKLELDHLKKLCISMLYVLDYFKYNTNIEYFLKIAIFQEENDEKDLIPLCEWFFKAYPRLHLKLDLLKYDYEQLEKLNHLAEKYGHAGLKEKIKMLF